MKAFYFLAAAPLLLGAGPAVDGETKRDLRCLIAVSSIATSDDKAVAMAGIIGSQYFFGRIEGRVPTLDLESALIAEVAILKDAEIPTLLQSCGKMMEDRGRILTAIGERMKNQAAHSSSSSS